MDFLHIGYMNIPVSLAGIIANFLGLYCSWTNRRSILSNSDKLALTLNILNAVFCTFLLPIKIIWYLTYSTMNVKPLFIGYIDALKIIFTSLLITLIAFNRYIKISKASRHHVILSGSRIHKLVLSMFVVSVALPMSMLIDLKISVIITAILFIGTNLLLVMFYALISKTMTNSRTRILLSANNVSHRVRGNIRGTQRSRFNRNVLILISTYLLCSFGLLAIIFHWSVKPSKDNFNLIMLGIWLMSLSSFINPIIYTLRNPAYRRIVRRMFRMNCRTVPQRQFRLNQIRPAPLPPPQHVIDV